MRIDEKTKQIKQEIDSLSQEIVMMSQLPMGNDPMLEKMKEKLYRLQLRYFVYANRN